MTIKRLLFITFYVAVLVWLFGSTTIEVSPTAFIHGATGFFSFATPFEVEIGKTDYKHHGSEMLGALIGALGAIVFWVALLGMGFVGWCVTTRSSKADG